MKQNTKTMMRRLSILVATIIVVLGSLNAKDHKPKHELENMHVSIKATEYKTSRFIEKETIKGKEYIKGKSSPFLL